MTLIGHGELINSTNGFYDLDGEAPNSTVLADQWLEKAFPLLFQSLPLPVHRFFDPDIVNPFAEDSVSRYSARTQTAFKLPEHGAVDGYIKLRLRAADNVG